MNADRLLAHFERISDAPDAVDRLRRFILDLAVRGKLVEQDPGDEPATNSLNRLSAVRLRHEATRQRRKPRRLKQEPLPPLGDVPSGWTLATLEELVEVRNGRAYAKSELLDKGTPVLRVGNLFTSQHWFFSDLELEDEKYCVEGDLLYAWSASFGPFLWRGPKVIFHYHIWNLVPHSLTDINKHYLYRFLLTETQRIKAEGHGVSMLHMTKDKMEQVFVPLPPLAEQHRIVEKVDELMMLCDRLEASQKERERRRDRLVVTSLARVTDANSDDATSATTSGYFHLDHLARLTARPEHVKKLRQTILNLAVRGRLVPQDDSEGSASALLDEVHETRSQRVQQGELRKAKGLKYTAPKEPLLTLPSGWAWCLADDLWDFENGDRSSNYPSKDQLVERGVPFVNAGHLVGNRVDLTQMNYITTAKFKSLGGGKLRKGDQVYCLRGSLGKHAVFSHECDAAIASSLVILRPVVKESVPFLAVYLDSDLSQQLLRRYDNGTAQPNLSSANLRRFEIPLPPLAEQKRIVAKVDDVMAICDQLEQQLQSQQKDRRRVLEALLHEALEEVG
jgi:type I restriction enzyme S subunit